MKNDNEMRISRMTNFKCQSTNVPFHRNENPRNQNGKIQMPNVKFRYWDFPTRTVSGRVEINLLR